MFSIYNNGSVTFRNTADNLYELKNVDQSAESRHKPDDDMIHDFSGSKKDKQTTLKAINSYKKIANIDTNEIIYHIKDIMSRKIFSILDTATVQEAYDILKEYKISQIPIVSKNNKIISIISKKIILNILMEDINKASYILKAKLNSLNLPDIITTIPLSDIRRVAKVMIDFKLDAMVVVYEDDTLAGIVSKTDIIKAVSHIPKFELWG